MYNLAVDIYDYHGIANISGILVLEALGLSAVHTLTSFPLPVYLAADPVIFLVIAFAGHRLVPRLTSRPVEYLYRKFGRRRDRGA